MLRRLFLSILFSLGSAVAQDGAELYTTYCSACHAPDGKGATGGQFPPLAGSAWVAGDADRAIKIVLHGLDGPIDVGGKTYNLIMPPQGAVLADDQIATILTHVRSSWGNKGEKVTAAQVTKIRATTSKRDIPWTAGQLLKQHPLPRGKQYLENLISRVYKGQWNALPDFEKLQAEAVEEEHDGLISLDKINHKSYFGVVWEGELMAPKTGDFQFSLDADDEARLIIAGKEIVKISGAGPMGRVREARVQLKEGANPFRLEYHQMAGQKGISLRWNGGGMKPNFLSSETSKSNSKKWPDIAIVPESNRTATYRNFIAGTTPRAIGFGFPGGVNLAYSGDHLAPELVWTGAFMDGGRHWTNRGQGNEPPAGDNLIKLTTSRALPDTARFRGYETDPAGNPTFITTIDTITLRDGYKTTDGNLVRTMTCAGNGQDLDVLVAEGISISKVDDTSWRLSEVIGLRVTGAALEERDKRLFLKLPAGVTATLTYDLP